MLRIVATRGEREFLSDVPEEALPALLADPEARVWVDLSGSMDDRALRIMRDVFRFHPLTIEECFDAREQPRADGFDGYVYVITHGMSATSTAEETETVELDAFLGHRYLVTYHAKESRSVAAVRDVLERGAGGPLRKGPANVLYAIVDRQADGIEAVLDDIEERLDNIEERVIHVPRNEDLATLLALKRTTLKLRRWVGKQREVVMRLARNEFGIISDQEAILFRDAHDHMLRYTDLLENFREIIGSLQDTYLNVTNLRLSEIMKFLTVFTAALMPLTVITGIYGMNFDHMPELRSRWGYPLTLASMAVTAITLLIFFRRKGWIGKDSYDPAAAARRAARDHRERR